MNLETLANSIVHYKQFHNMDGYIKCCKLKFTKGWHVEDHIKLHVRPDMFQWVNSDISALHRSKLNSIGIFHFRCPMHGCKSLLRTRMSRITHLIQHRNENRFECDICGQIYTRKKALRQHMSALHSGISCDMCQKKSVYCLWLQFNAIKLIRLYSSCNL